MTTGEMLLYTNRLKEIRSIKNTDLRNARLANLMTDLEHAYNIPMLNNDDYNAKHPFVMQLYRTVSAERTF